MTLLFKCNYYFILNGNSKNDNCQKFKKCQEQMIPKIKTVQRIRCHFLNLNQLF